MALIDKGEVNVLVSIPVQLYGVKICFLSLEPTFLFETLSQRIPAAGWGGVGGRRKNKQPGEREESGGPATAGKPRTLRAPFQGSVLLESTSQVSMLSMPRALGQIPFPSSASGPGAEHQLCRVRSGRFSAVFVKLQSCDP